MKALKVGNYQLTEKIYETKESVIYKALDIENQEQIVVKKLNYIASDNRAEAFYRFKKEADIISSLTHTNIVKMYDYIEDDQSFYIVMEFFEGFNLKDVHKKVDINQKVFILIEIARTLSFIHNNNILHRDIKPENILIKLEDPFELKIIDFGLAYLMDIKKIFLEGKMVGSFSYMAPEQTGLLRRPIDNRSDLYSLGATFYEILVGRPPFVDNDLSKIIHKHLAEKPDYPSKYDSDIPVMLDEITLKLLAKEPEERYQTAEGLILDLEKFVQSDGKKRFAIGANDKRGKINFQIKMVGREEEIKIISNKLHFIDDFKPQFGVVIGRSGSGKSKLLETFFEDHISENTILISHKCSISTQNIPYSPFVEVIKSYIQDYSDEQQVKKLLNDKNLNISFLVNLFPYLKKYLTDENPIEHIEQQKIDENQKSKFLNAIKIFIEEIGRYRNKIIFSIDDIQWADSESLELFIYLIQYLKNTKIMFLTTLREENYDEALFLKVKDQKNMFFVRIALLLKKNIELIVDRIVNDEVNLGKTFYDKVYQNTLGNPYFIFEMMKLLYQNKILFYKENKWNVDERKLAQFTLDNNISNLLLNRIKELDEENINILSIASLIGKEFRIDFLNDLIRKYKQKNQFDKDKDDIAKIIAVIDQAKSQHIIEEDLSKGKGVYHFVHDKIVETLHDYLSDEQEKKLHLICAKTLEEKYKDEQDKIVYRIAFHYNKTDDSQKMLKFNKLAYTKALTQFSSKEAVFYMKKMIDYHISTNNLNKENIALIVQTSYFLRIIGLITESIAYLKIGLEEVRKKKWQEDEISILLQIGEGNHYLNDRSTALKYYHDAFSLAENINMEIKTSSPYMLTGISYYFDFELDKSDYYLTKAIAYTQKTDLENLLLNHVQRARVYFTMGEMSKAQSDVKFAESKIGKIDNLILLSQLYHMCSQYYAFSGEDLKKSLDYSFKAFDYGKKSNNILFQYSSLFSRIFAYLFLGEYDLVIQTGDDVVKMSSENNVFIGYYICRSYVAEAYFWKNDFEKADEISKKYYREFKKNKENLKDSLSLLGLLKLRLVCKYYKGEIEECLDLLEEAEAVFDESDVALVGIFILTFKSYVLKQVGALVESKDTSGKLQSIMNKKTGLDFLYQQSQKLIKVIENAKSDKKRRDSFSGSVSYVKERFQLENIIKTSQMISSILDVNELLNQLLIKTIEVSGAERGLITLFLENENDEYFLKNMKVNEVDFEIAKIFISKVQVQNEGIVVNEGQIDFYNKEFYTNIKSIVCTPLVLKDKIIGSLYLDSKLLKGLFSIEDLKLLDVFTSQAAIAIDNAKAYKELEKERNLLDERVKIRTQELSKKSNEIENLNNITQKISMSLNFDTVFNEIFGFLKDIYDFECCGLALVTPDGEHYRFEKDSVPDYLENIVHSFRGLTFPISNKGGRIAQCIKNNKHYFANNINPSNLKNKQNKQWILEQQVESILIMPITINNEVIGVFNLFTNTVNISLSEEDITSIQRFVNQIAVILRNSRLYKELRDKSEELEYKNRIISEDLLMAKNIQRNILSEEYKEYDQLDIEVFFQPMIEVGGDIYDINRLSKKHYRVFIADATGHGVQAALTTMLIKTEYDKVKDEEELPNVILSMINNSFLERYYNLSVFFTCILVDINLYSNEIIYASAGHPNQYFFTNKEFLQLKAGGKMLGMFKDSIYELRKVPIIKNDRLVLFTDGAMEEFSEKGKELGEKGLERLILSNKAKQLPEFISGIVYEIDLWRGNEPYNDDVTIIGIDF